MRILILISFLIVLQACKTDTKVQHELSGTWQVRTSLPENSEEDEITLTPEAEKESEPETTEEAANASENQNDSNDFAKGLTQMANGIEQLAEGLVEIGEGIGKGIKEAIVENLSGTVTLNADSTLQFLPKISDQEIQLGQENIRWWVKDGNFLIQTSPTDSVMQLTIVPVADGYDLRHEKVHIHLRKPE